MKHIVIPVFIVTVFLPLFCDAEDIFEPEAKYVSKGSYFKLNPIFITETQYTDNLFTTRSDKRSDWVTTLSPGLVSSFSRPRFNYELEYQAGFVYHLHHPERDYTSQDVNFNAIAKISSRLTFSLLESYRRSIDSVFDELIDTGFERTVRRQRLFIFNRNISCNCI